MTLSYYIVGIALLHGDGYAAMTLSYYIIVIALLQPLLSKVMATLL